MLLTSNSTALLNIKGSGTVGLPRDVNIISAGQAKAARAVLGLSVGKLADRAGISASSIRRVEEGQPVTMDLTLKLQRHFEDAGLTFLWRDQQQGLLWPLPAVMMLAP